MGMNKRDIRASKWFEEVAEYFNLDPVLVQEAVPPKRVDSEHLPMETKKARLVLQQMFMCETSIDLLEKIRTEDLEHVSDIERSNSWSEYVFVCVNGEKRAFEKMFLYDQIIGSIVEPILKCKDQPVIVDYGCGSSLLTRMISQDFGHRVKTISVDVCKYAVEFSVARNRLYNKNACGILIEDVAAPLKNVSADLILAYAVLEHLPNSTDQIQGLIDCLSVDGVLIENYSGHSSAIPHKSDTTSAYKNRDRNLDLLRNQLFLLYGALPRKRNGIYERDRGNRYWIKENGNQELLNVMRRRLQESRSVRNRILRKVEKFLQTGGTL